MPRLWDFTGNDPFARFVVDGNGLIPKYRKRPNIDRSSPGAITVTGLRSAASSIQAIGVGCEGSKRIRSFPAASSSVPFVESYAKGVPGGVRLAVVAEPSSVIRVTKPTGRHGDGTAPSKPGKST